MLKLIAHIGPLEGTSSTSSRVRTTDYAGVAFASKAKVYDFLRDPVFKEGNLRVVGEGDAMEVYPVNSIYKFEIIE